MSETATTEMFDTWLEDMHPRLARFEDFQLPTQLTKDYSRESLGQFETYLLDRFPDQAAFLTDPDTEFIDGAVRYIGETLLRAAGGGWHFSDDPDFVFTGRPFLRLDTPDRTPISPYNMMTALLKRRTGRELTKLFDNQQLNVEEKRAVEGPDWRPRRDPIPGLVEDASQPEPERDVWTRGLGDRLAGLRARAGADVGDRLDTSPDSLAVLEPLVLADYADPAELTDPARRDTTDAYVAYLGETARRAAGGDWVLRPGDQAGPNPYLGNPFVSRTDDEGDLRSHLPIAALHKLVRSRTSGTLAGSLRAYTED